MRNLPSVNKLLEIRTVKTSKRIKSCMKFSWPNCSSTGQQHAPSKWGHVPLPSLCWQTPVTISKCLWLDLKTRLTFKLTLNIIYLLFWFTETWCPLLLSSDICPLQWCTYNELFQWNLKQKGLTTWVTKISLFKEYYLSTENHLITMIQCLHLISLSIHTPCAFQIHPQAHFQRNSSNTFFIK